MAQCFPRAKVTGSHSKFSFFVGKRLLQLASQANGEEALGCPAFNPQGPCPRPAGQEEAPHPRRWRGGGGLRAAC